MKVNKTVNVPSITCGHCVMTIQREVGGIEGVHSVKADAGGKSVTIEWNDPPTSWQAIQACLVEMNHPPKDEQP